MQIGDTRLDGQKDGTLARGLARRHKLPASSHPSSATVAILVYHVIHKRSCLNINPFQSVPTNRAHETPLCCSFYQPLFRDELCSSETALVMATAQPPEDDIDLFIQISGGFVERAVARRAIQVSERAFRDC